MAERYIINRVDEKDLGRVCGLSAVDSEGIRHWIPFRYQLDADSVLKKGPSPGTDLFPACGWGLSWKWDLSTLSRTSSEVNCVFCLPCLGRPFDDLHAEKKP